MQIKLHPFTPDDIDRLRSWIRTEEEMVQWSGPYFKFPLQPQDLLDYQHTSQMTPAIRQIFKAVQQETGIVVGHIELNDLDFNFRSASISRVLVNPEYRGFGICLSMMNAVLLIAFNQLHLHRLSLRVYDFNRPAIRCYEQAGFRREGFFRHFSRVGDQWWDSWSMAILEDEWRAIQAHTVQDLP